jgi:hypothetical protein
MTCGNNLKQIGLAVHGYHDTNNRIPPSRLSDIHATWAVLIMPWIEQDNLFNQWNLALDYYSQNQTARQTPVPLYFCPARRTSKTLPMTSLAGDQNDDLPGGLGPFVPGALGDYAACIGTENCDGVDCVGAVTGAFRAANDLNGNALGVVTFLMVADGLSNTIFVGEKHVPFGFFGNAPGAGPGGLDCSFYNGDYPLCSCRSGGPLYPIVQSPLSQQAGFGGYHLNVCQFLFGDGSVHILSSQTDPNTMALLANIADGQVLPPY